ncbi:hypothetical protein [Herpetosiphon llansteffanensis]|uniref:hypothetical protein n=1 Tax=Herpetosiphon llansteffanensis TaxID=2094568 RepID=UPI000D7C849D|nr:hypothetical protein [Herpetosiphon llansteffanensis]
MWMSASFLPTSLFSLRPALATASGAQSLLVPTPFAIKMALVSNVIQLFGIDLGSHVWPAIRDAEIALKLPELVVVAKTFIKIQRPKRFKQNNQEEFIQALNDGLYPFNPTIAFREFVQFEGEVGIAIKIHDSQYNKIIESAFKHISYFGKRGGFWQRQTQIVLLDTLDYSWINLTINQTSIFIQGTLQLLDDCGKKLSWEHVNIYSEKSIKIDNDERILRPIVLPYTLTRSSYRYTVYTRIEEPHL